MSLDNKLASQSWLKIWKADNWGCQGVSSGQNSRVYEKGQEGGCSCNSSSGKGEAKWSPEAYWISSLAESKGLSFTPSQKLAVKERRHRLSICMCVCPCTCTGTHNNIYIHAGRVGRWEGEQRERRVKRKKKEKEATKSSGTQQSPTPPRELWQHLGRFRCCEGGVWLASEGWWSGMLLKAHKSQRSLWTTKNFLAIM